MPTNSAIFQDGDFVIFSPLAIALYLSNSQLKGSTVHEQALVLKWINFSESELAPAVGCFCNARPNDQIRAKQNLISILSKLNTIILSCTYLVGERISLADIALYCYLLPAYQTGLDAAARKPFTNLNRWFQTVRHQPKVDKVVGPFQLCEVVKK